MHKYTQQVSNNRHLENKEEVINWIDTVLKNYLENNVEDIGEVEHILDYFVAKEKKCKLRKKSFHLAKTSYQEAKESARKWVATLKKQGNNIVETEADVQHIKDLGGKMRLVKLISSDAYRREGTLMSHCVGSYYDKNGLDIYSIRDENNRPVCTLEVNGENLNQIKGKGNGSIHHKYIKCVISALKFFKKDIRPHEMPNLGYRKLTPVVFSLYLNAIKNFKYISLGGNNYMYVDQKIELK